MSGFKAGDKVRARQGAVGIYGNDVGGGCGVVTTLNTSFGGAPAGYTYVVFEEGVGSRFVKTSDLEKIGANEMTSEIKAGDTVLDTEGRLGVVTRTTALDTDVRFHGDPHKTWRATRHLKKVNTDLDAIDVALGEIQDEEELCSDFDTLVGYANDMPLLARLKAVAEQNNRTNLYENLIERLIVSPAPAYEPPTVPNEGDYVKVTYLNGDTVEGEVRDVDDYGFMGFKVGKRWTIIPEPGDVFIEREPHNVAATIEVVKQPVKPVEIDGYWVKRRRIFDDVAAWSSVECEGLPQVNASNMEGAWDYIHSYSNEPSMRGYVPALLAVIKFFEQEKETV